jgi:hypothetical protein
MAAPAANHLAVFGLQSILRFHWRRMEDDLAALEHAGHRFTVRPMARLVFAEGGMLWFAVASHVRDIYKFQGIELADFWIDVSVPYPVHGPLKSVLQGRIRHQI